MKSINIRNFATYTLWIVFLFAIAVLLNLSSTPTFKEIGPDSGLFAYAGKLILNGKVPYVDFWDHKPPLVFYWNALGQWIFGQNVWGIWWFTTTWITIVASVYYWIIRKMLGMVIAMAGSIIFLFTAMAPSLYQGGNFTEIYALLPQIFIIGCLSQYFRTKKDGWLIVIGALSAICLLTKQPTIGLSLSIFLTIVYIGFLQRKYKEIVRQLIFFIIGAAIPLITAVLLMMQAHIFGVFWDANFSHSIAYVSEGGFSLGTFARTLKIIFFDFPLGSIALTACISLFFYCTINYKWLFPFWFQGSDWKNRMPRPIEMVMLSIFLAMPMEVILASLGGRNFGHYFITSTPVFITAAIFLPEQFSQLYINTQKRFQKWIPILIGIVGLLTIIWIYQAIIKDLPTSQQLAQLNDLIQRPYQLNKLEKYVIENSRPDEYVFVWHDHPGMNFSLNRPSPTRYLFPTFLTLNSPQQSYHFNILMDELQKNKPKLILVQEPNSVGLPSFASPDQEICPNCTPEVAKGMIHLKNWVNTNYVPQAEIYDWVVYLRINAKDH